MPAAMSLRKGAVPADAQNGASPGSAWPLWSAASVPTASRACFSGSEARTSSLRPLRTMLKNSGSSIAAVDESWRCMSFRMFFAAL